MKMCKNSKKLISSSKDLYIIVWDLDSFQMENYFKVGAFPVYTLKITQDEKSIYCLSSDQVLTSKTLLKTDKNKTFEGFYCGLNDESFDVSEELGIICGISNENYKQLLIYNLSIDQIINRVEGHQEDINCVKISQLKRKVITAGNDCMIIIRDITKFEIEFTLNNLHISDIRTICFGPLEQSIFSGSDDKRLYQTFLDDRSDNKGIYSKIKFKIVKILFNSKSNQIISASDKKNRINLWNLSKHISRSLIIFIR